MPYVPAHTNTVGQFTLSGQNTVTIENPTKSSTTGTHVVARSYKSVTRTGVYSPLVPSFIRPTQYTRCIQRCDDISGGFDYYGYKNSRGEWGRHEVGTDSRRGAYGVVGQSHTVNFAGTVAVSSNMQNRAVAEALNKLNAQKINLGTALAEGRQTVAMVARSMITLLKVVRALKQLNPSLAYWYLFGRRRGVQTRQLTHETWLSWQYGWLPLISDIWGGIEQIQKGFREESLLFSVERTITEPLSTHYFFQDPTSMQIEGEAWESCKVKLWGRVTGDIFKANALGLINPAAVAWELVPYSFVIDWLVPVGAWLESLTSAVGVQFVAGCRTNLVFCDATAERIHMGTSREVSGRKPKARNRVLGMSRVSYSSWPWALPYWKSPFTITHVASATALLSQLRK